MGSNLVVICVHNFKDVKIIGNNVNQYNSILDWIFPFLILNAIKCR